MHHSIKDGVYERLSRIFSDSHETAVDRQPEAKSQATPGKSLSSVLSSVIPSVSFDWFRQNEVPDMMKSDGSHSYKWRSKIFSWKEKPLERHLEVDNEYETQYNISHNMQNDEHDSRSPSYQESFDSPSGNGEMRSSISTSSCSDVFEDVHTPHSFDKSMCSLVDDSLFINPDLYQFFEASLPNIVKGCQWVLLYSTARDGISLQTLFRKSAGLSGPCLLITGDKQGAVFGGLIDCPLKPTAKRKYQGTNQSFVFSTIYGEPRLFRPTGANRYFYLCLNDLLALGGGGHFALCLNEDLLSGTSGPCETFGNLCLAHDQEFEAKNVELWGFTHSSQYLHCV